MYLMANVTFFTIFFCYFMVVNIIDEKTRIKKVYRH